MINELNRKFGIEGHVSFQTGTGDLAKAVVTNQRASAEIYLHGAHVTSFQPHGSTPVLWLSDIAEYESEKAIRGGIPVIWPWFGPHPQDKTKPQHGFARVSEWELFDTTGLPDGRTRLRLQLKDNVATRTLWPHPFELELNITVGARLRIELTSRNTDQETVEIGGALHTYFNIGDITQITIEGLDGREYFDQLDSHRVKLQNGSISISEEVDRIYLDTVNECVITDPNLKRKIRVSAAGSRTTVIWNPWIDKSQRMADFPDEGYRTMVCIEATNAADDIYRVPPGGEHTLSQTISTEHI